MFKNIFYLFTHILYLFTKILYLFTNIFYLFTNILYLLTNVFGAAIYLSAKHAKFMNNAMYYGSLKKFRYCKSYWARGKWIICRRNLVVILFIYIATYVVDIEIFFHTLL